jgi:hypothetical protein
MPFYNHMDPSSIVYGGMYNVWSIWWNRK